MNYTKKLYNLLKKVEIVRFNKNDRSQLKVKLYDCLILTCNSKFIYMAPYFTDHGKLTIALMESKKYQEHNSVSVMENSYSVFLNNSINFELDIKYIDPVFLSRFAEIIETEFVVNKHLKKLNSIVSFKKIDTKMLTALVYAANIRSYAVKKTSFEGLYNNFNCSIDCNGHKTSLYLSLRSSYDFFYISIQFGNTMIRNQLGVCGITGEYSTDFVPLEVRYVEPKFFYAVQAYVRILNELNKKQIKRIEKENL